VHRFIQEIQGLSGNGRQAFPLAASFAVTALQSDGCAHSADVSSLFARPEVAPKLGRGSRMELGRKFNPGLDHGAAKWLNQAIHLIKKNVVARARRRLGFRSTRMMNLRDPVERHNFANPAWRAPQTSDSWLLSGFAAVFPPQLSGFCL
jgi:hypothetical protein